MTIEEEENNITTDREADVSSGNFTSDIQDYHERSDSLLPQVLATSSRKKKVNAKKMS